jgi:predicted P-loop ATPase
VLILQGPQGIGKSTAIRTLFGDDFFTDSLPHDLGAKDAKDHLLGSWGIELPELSQMRKSDVESIKAFISRQEERYRPAYGRNEVNFPRQCVFLGTTNAAQFLRDETGNRRFWPVTVTKVNTDALARERDQFWAEAKHRLNTGESYWIDEGSEPRLAQVARDATDERIIENPYLGILARYLENRTNEEVTHEQIFQHLDIKTDRRRTQAPDVSQAMTTLGWKPNKSKRNKKWHYAG